jgi:hypothetical protein
MSGPALQVADAGSARRQLKRGDLCVETILRFWHGVQSVTGLDSARNWLFCGADPQENRGHMPIIVGIDMQRTGGAATRESGYSL